MNKAKEIRQALKEQLGYNARQVSVRERQGGYSYSFILTVRDASVNLQKVEEFARGCESIDRCERTYEILSGGNTFVRVSVLDEVEEIWSGEHLEEVTGALKEVSELPTNQSSVRLLNDQYSIIKGRCENSVELIETKGRSFGMKIGTFNYPPTMAKNISLLIYKSLAS